MRLALPDPVGVVRPESGKRDLAEDACMTVTPMCLCFLIRNGPDDTASASRVPLGRQV